ncbi:MAG: hypothetical protein WD492_12915 [Alkalispirochaeta sp.]
MSFALDLQRFADTTQRRMSVIPRKVALELFRRVVMRTPIDEGRARGNWQAGVGTPPAGETDSKGGSAAIEQIAAEVESWDAESIAIYLVNNVPYIVPLEDGHSGQAPQGMVKISLAEFPDIVETMTREGE